MRPRLPAAALALVAVLVWVPSAASAEHSVTRPGSWRLSYRSIPDPIPTNALFELELRVDDLAAGAGPPPSVVSVDARMPDHRHGMTLVPRLEDLGGGRYRVEGMLFHMPGLWVMEFGVSRGDASPQRARFEVQLE